MRLFISDRVFYRKALSLALPMILQSFISIGVNTTDTIMLGQFGEAQLSAASLSNSFYSIFIILCFGIGGGAVVMTSRFWGSGEKDNIKKVITIMLRISVSVGLLFMLGTWIMPGKILSAYTHDQSVIAYGAKYYRFLCFAFLFQSVSLTATLVLRSIGKATIPLAASGCSFLLNIFFNWMFMFGKLGAPRLEIQGAAIGTLIARIIECIFIFGYVLVIDKRVEYRVKDLFSTGGHMMPLYLKYSVPVIVSDLMLALGNNVIAFIMAQIGRHFVAANSITMVTVQVCSLFSMAIAMSASITIGNTMGDGDKERAMREGVTFLNISVLLGIISGLLILSLKPVVIDYYKVTDYTKEIAVKLMNAVSFIVVFRTVSSMLTKGVLRGGGDTRFLMLADILFLWVASIPLGAFAGLVLHADPFIVYCCLSVDMIIKTVWCILRLFKRRWMQDIHVVTSAVSEAEAVAVN
jgi:putative MATE family efflux protein